MFYVLLFSILIYKATTEEYSWNYDKEAFGGQKFWGLMLGKDSEMCGLGKLQSPIDVQPENLLFDPQLKPMQMNRQTVMSELVNTGQMVRVRIGNIPRKPSVNLTEGPLCGYKYRYNVKRNLLRVQRIDIHFGKEDHNGSEHTIDGRRFPMEIQMLAYNIDLYNNFSHALRSPHGLAAIAVLVDYGQETNEELLKLTVATASINYKGQRVELADFAPWKLLPYTRDYVTYEGSMTSPGCYETVTWIIINQPIHISRDDLAEWGRVMQSTLSDPTKSGEEPRYMAPNARALQNINNRLLRTNIQHKIKSKQECKLPIPKMYKTGEFGQKTVHISKHRRRHAHNSQP